MFSVILFIAVLVGLIVVHEFGHFVVAKRAGIRVDEFGIFFGPSLFRRRVGETDYTVNLLPIGGFVRIFGENADEIPKHDPDHARAFFAKPKLVQAAVLAAGVAFNVLLAWVLISIALMIGVPANPSNAPGVVDDVALTVVSVIEDSPAAHAGIESGDIIERISSDGAQPAQLSPEHITEFIGAREGEPVMVFIERGGEVQPFDVVPARAVIEDEAARAAIGISMGQIGTLALPPHRAVVEGFVRTATLTGAVAVGIVSFLADVLTLSADLSSVAGPVGIVSLAGDAAALGLVSLLMFVAIISIHLAVINLLPIPALDGGRLLFLLIETVTGSPIRPSVATVAHTVGFILLIVLMLVVTYGDIVRLAS